MILNITVRKKALELIVTEKRADYVTVNMTGKGMLAFIVTPFFKV